MDKNTKKAKKLLIVEDDPLQLRLLQKHVENCGYEVLLAENGVDAMQIVLSEGPRVVLTDWMMPQMDGLQLCRSLREHEGVRFVYLIVVTSNTRNEHILEAFEAGADDFLSKPVNQAELLGRLRAADRIVCLESDLAKRSRELHRVNAEMALTHQKLNHANEQLRRMATTDELTGLINRREALARLKEAWSGRERYGHGFSVIAADIDHFKSFNDTYGHAAGDLVLKTTARVLKSAVRTTDKVCRMGGEEFLIICPGVQIEGATACAEHLRSAIENHKYRYDGADLRVTLSLGVAEPADGMLSADELLRAADGALYQSKHDGRNRVTVAMPVESGGA